MEPEGWLSAVQPGLVLPLAVGTFLASLVGASRKRGSSRQEALEVAETAGWVRGETGSGPRPRFGSFPGLVLGRRFSLSPESHSSNREFVSSGSCPKVFLDPALRPPPSPSSRNSTARVHEKRTSELGSEVV